MDSETTKQVELANACFAKGRKLWGKGDRNDALGLFRKALAIQESVLGTYHKSTARTYYWVGFALKHNKEYEKALVAYRRTLRIRISMLGQEDISTEDVKRALRDVLTEKKFANQAIEEYFKQAANSVQHEKSGNSSSSDGDFGQAVEEYEKCLEIEEKAIGRFPLDIALVYSKIGGIHLKQDEPEKAITAFREALSIYESTLGNNHPHTIACIEGIESSAYTKGLEEAEVKDYCSSVYESIWQTKKGDAFHDGGEYEKAILSFEAAIDIEESILGKYSLTAASIYRRLAVCFSSMGKYARAILALRTVLTILIFECGSDHQSVLTTLKDIGQTMKAAGYNSSDTNKYLNTVSYSVKYERYGEHIRKQGDYFDALEEFQKSLALEKSALGKYHLTQAALFRSIGNAFSGQGKLDHAIVNYRQSLMIYLCSLGESHFETHNTLKRIGYAAEDKGMTNHEIEGYKDATCKSIRVEITGDKIAKEGREEKAITTYLTAIALEDEHLGPFHMCTAGLHNKIAAVLEESKCYDRALVKCRNVLGIYEGSLGQDHPNSQKARAQLKLVAMKKGLDEAGAEAYCRQASESIGRESSGDKMTQAKTYDKAIIEYNNAIGLEESILGKSHLTTVSLQQKIADISRLKGHFNRAVLLNKEIFRIFHANSLPDHGDGSAASQSLDLALQGLGFDPSHTMKYRKAVWESVQCEANGDAALKTGKHDDALHEYRRAVFIEEAVLGKLHLNTAAVYQKMAIICRDRNDFQSAIVLYSKALAILESHFGKESAETLRTYNSLLNVTQKEAAVTKANLEGWTTLNYVLMGLIGLLVLIATIVKSLSARQMSVKHLSLSSLEDRRERDDETTSKSTGMDPDGTRSPRGANAIKSSGHGTGSPANANSPASGVAMQAFPRRKSLDPPQWGGADEPEAAKFDDKPLFADGQSAGNVAKKTRQDPVNRVGSDDGHAQTFEGAANENEDISPSLDRPSDEDATSAQRCTDDQDSMSKTSQHSSEAELHPDLVKRFRNLQSKHESAQPQGKKSNQHLSDHPSNQKPEFAFEKSEENQTLPEKSSTLVSSKPKSSWGPSVIEKSDSNRGPGDLNGVDSSNTLPSDVAAHPASISRGDNNQLDTYETSDANKGIGVPATVADDTSPLNEEPGAKPTQGAGCVVKADGGQESAPTAATAGGGSQTIVPYSDLFSPASQPESLDSQPSFTFLGRDDQGSQPGEPILSSDQPALDNDENASVKNVLNPSRVESTKAEGSQLGSPAIDDGEKETVEEQVSVRNVRSNESRPREGRDGVTAQEPQTGHNSSESKSDEADSVPTGPPAIEDGGRIAQRGGVINPEELNLGELDPGPSGPPDFEDEDEFALNGGLMDSSESKSSEIDSLPADPLDAEHEKGSLPSVEMRQEAIVGSDTKNDDSSRRGEAATEGNDGDRRSPSDDNVDAAMGSFADKLAFARKLERSNSSEQLRTRMPPAIADKPFGHASTH